MANVDYTRVFLEDLPPDVRKAEISKEFSSFGKIAKIYLIYDPPGSGFVEFFEASDAAFAAEQMNGESFMGARIKTKLTKGGAARGRPPLSRDDDGRRSYDSGRFDREPRDSYSRGGGGFRGGRSREFEPRGRGSDRYGGGGDRYGSSRGGYDRGSYGGGMRSRGFSRGGRSFSRGFGGRSSRGRGSFSRDDNGSRFSSRHFDGDSDYKKENGRFSDSYDKYSKYSRAERPTNDYTRYPSASRFQGRRNAGYDDHSRSPLNRSPARYDDYPVESGGSSYARSRSPQQGGF